MLAVAFILFAHYMNAQQQCNPGTIACIDTLATNVAVVSVSGTYRFEDTCLWVCSGITATLANGPSGHGLNNVYVESNATVNISSGINGILAKSGATVNLLPGSTATLVVCEPGAHIRQNGNPWSGNCTCSEVIFDYTYAPAAQECLSTGVDRLHTTRTLQIFPNPANDFVTIKLTAYSNADEIILSNLIGSQINTWQIARGELHISTASLPAGVYSVAAISDEKATLVKKLMICR